MCGIFGYVGSPKSSVAPQQAWNLVKKLFILSETRGKEAAGVAAKFSGALHVYKEPCIASEMIRSVPYSRLVAEGGKAGDGLSIIGHSRLVTNGLQEMNANNQPVVTGGIVGIHNGIVTNVDDLWAAHPELQRQTEVDTEVMLAIMNQALEKGESLEQATRVALCNIEGSASMALLFMELGAMVLATNTGSLYSCRHPDGAAMVFASERYILKSLLEEHPQVGFLVQDIRLLAPKRGLVINERSGEITEFTVIEPSSEPPVEVSRTVVELRDESSQAPQCRDVQVMYRGRTIADDVRRQMTAIWERVHTPGTVRRCTRCILPATMPFIDFDDQGVCNFCRNSQPLTTLGRDALERVLEPYRSRDGSQDCIVSLSGGRDSCYGLHYLKRELGMNPITFTYDWGLVTDLARRNQARMCGKLGVEHVLISADIAKKRRNIRKNINAWFKKPELGMLPLLMAGDKQMLYYSNQLSKQTGIELIIHGVGSGYEQAPFKLGFAGVNMFERKSQNFMTFSNKLAYLGYYAGQYLGNPRYMNVSLMDTLFAFFCNFLLPMEFVELFRFLPWEENEVESVLKDEYGWETAEDTRTTWRIGDGTAAFYNYVYMTVAALTEHDTFRSHQIRDGKMTRDEALERAKEDNMPRFESIEWYAETIGFDVSDAMRLVNSIPKLYTS